MSDKIYIVSLHEKASIFCANSSVFRNFKAQFHGFAFHFLFKYSFWDCSNCSYSIFPPFATESNKSPNLFERTKEDIEGVIHKQKKSPHRHHKETHGTSDDIDENTPINEVKGPSVFQRAKEELEAILDAIHPKKDSSRHFNPSTNKKEEEEEGGGGFKDSIGRGLEKICCPMNHHSRD